MLALTRKKNERVVIGGLGLVEVLEIRGDKVRLGFAFPREVSVHREEIQRVIDGQAAAGVGTESPEGSEAPPAAAPSVAFLCQAVGYPMSDRVVRASGSKEAAEEFVRSYRRTDSTPINVRVQRSSAYEPTATYRVEQAAGGDPVASLIGLRAVIDPRDDATFEAIERATAQEIFEAGVYEREGA